MDRQSCTCGATNHIRHTALVAVELVEHHPYTGPGLDESEGS